MKLGQFRTYLVSLLLVFAICGTGLANFCDFSDYHDSHVLHIDRADSHGSDMDDFKHKISIFPAITFGPFHLPLPSTAFSFLAPSAVKLIHPQLLIALSLPSRASPV
jgi:hypothetical protein